jgi:23S rRNA (uracil1939-C5)-methyltransferase
MTNSIEASPMNNARATKILEIAKLDDDFKGVAYVGADRYVVDGALPQEQVRVREFKCVGSVHLCRTLEVLRPSPYRVTPPCPHAAQCGGCDLLHASYSYQLTLKKEYIRRKLHGVVPPSAILDTLSVTGFRNKVHLAFWREGGITAIGFIDDRTHRVVDVAACNAHGTWYAHLVKAVRRWLTDSAISVYDPATRKGTLRYIVARYIGDSLSVTVVATAPNRHISALFAHLAPLAAHVGLWLNLNTARTNAVFGDRFEHIAGEPSLDAEMLGVRFTLEPASFFQTNTQVAEAVYRHICEGISADIPVVDLYSGIGITSVLFARKAPSVTSVEVNPAACRNARRTAMQNGVADRVSIHCGDVADLLPRLDLPTSATFFVDPPRAGLGEAVCRAIIAKRPNMLWYLSCNPSTLVADLRALAAVYTVDYALPIDMFPNTRHIETLVRLSLVDAHT